jgi:hypothetical protein
MKYFLLILAIIYLAALNTLYIHTLDIKIIKLIMVQDTIIYFFEFIKEYIKKFILEYQGERTHPLYSLSGRSPALPVIYYFF